MLIEDFIICMIDEINENKQAFIDNLNHLNSEHNGKKERTFCEWIETFNAWMEWSTDQCNNNHDYTNNGDV